MAEKIRGLRHDKVGLQRLRLIDGKVLEGDGCTGHWVDISQSQCVAGFVVPGLEVGRLGRANAEQDSQNLDIAHSLSERRVKTCATLLDEGEVESGGEGDGFEVVGDVMRRKLRWADQIIIGPRNCGS